MMKLAVQFECILRVHLNRTPSPHFQCWWIVLACHMLANVIGVNIEVGGRGAKGNEEEFGCVFQQTIFPSKLRI